MPPLNKRRKLSDDEESDNDNNSANEEPMSDVSVDQNSSGVEDNSDDTEIDSEDDMDGVQKPKSKKTMKRKIRATKASTFGAALQSLLQTEAPSSLPLSLKPSIARKHQDNKLELKAKKILAIEKKEQEDKRRIKDVIGGWGGESERALRKVAQRGGKYSSICSFARLTKFMVV